MWDIFQDEYLPNPAAPWGRFALKSVKQDSAVDGDTTVDLVLRDGAAEVELSGTGNGPIAAFCNALEKHGVDVRVLDYSEHAMSAGGDARAAAYLECSVGDRVLWGAGIDPSIVTSSLKAVISAVNRAQRA
jgi:2-isopropylmalate synthase